MSDFSPRLEAVGRAGLARARAELAAHSGPGECIHGLGDPAWCSVCKHGPTVPPATGAPTDDGRVVLLDTTPEERAARLRERAHARTLGGLGDPGDDAA
jgi:hypothetical protein